jgi:large subunit ribosomal protein L21
MYAILRQGGHQHRVSSGDRLLVDRIGAEVGDVVGLEPVLLLSDEAGVKVARADLDGVRVAATVLAHRRGRKLRVFTYKPKKRHRRTLGFRAELTELVVDRILGRGEPLPQPVRAVAPAESEPAEPAAPVRSRRAAAPEPAEPAAPLRSRRAAAPAASELEPEAVPVSRAPRRARAAVTEAPEAAPGPDPPPAPRRRASPARKPPAGGEA